MNRSKKRLLIGFLDGISRGMSIWALIPLSTMLMMSIITPTLLFLAGGIAAFAIANLIIATTIFNKFRPDRYSESNNVLKKSMYLAAGAVLIPIVGVLLMHSFPVTSPLIFLAYGLSFAISSFINTVTKWYTYRSIERQHRPLQTAETLQRILQSHSYRIRIRPINLQAINLQAINDTDFVLFQALRPLRQQNPSSEARQQNRTTNEELFNSLAVPANELAALRATHLELTPGDINKLSNNAAAQKVFDRYNKLWARLIDTDTVCPIAQERPNEPENQALLVKLYLNETDTWTPVPDGITFFSGQGLKDLIIHNGERAKHPFLNESIKFPPDYNGYQTQYVWHPYQQDGVLLSQELTELEREIKFYLDGGVSYEAHGPVEDERRIQASM